MKPLLIFAVAVAVGLSGCGEVERPRAIGLILDPAPLNDADNKVLMREILEAARPHPQLLYPPNAAWRHDEYLSGRIDALEALIARGDFTAARKVCARIRSDLLASIGHDSDVVKREAIAHSANSTQEHP